MVPKMEPSSSPCKEAFRWHQWQWQACQLVHWYRHRCAWSEFYKVLRCGQSERLDCLATKASVLPTWSNGFCVYHLFVRWLLFGHLDWRHDNQKKIQGRDAGKFSEVILRMEVFCPKFSQSLGLNNASWVTQMKLTGSKKKDLSQECPPKKCGKKHMIDVVLGKKSWISSRKKIAFVLFLAPKNIGILPLRSFLKASGKCEKSPFSVFITRWSCVRTREDWTSSILVRTRSTWSTWCRWI